MTDAPPCSGTVAIQGVRPRLVLNLILLSCPELNKTVHVLTIPSVNDRGEDGDQTTRAFGAGSRPDGQAALMKGDAPAIW